MRKNGNCGKVLGGSGSGRHAVGNKAALQGHLETVGRPGVNPGQTLNKYISSISSSFPICLCSIGQKYLIHALTIQTIILMCELPLHTFS